MSKLQPSSIENLQGELATCNNVDDVDLSQLSRLVEHVPEDMTATVEAGMTLGLTLSDLDPSRIASLGPRWHVLGWWSDRFRWGILI